LWTAREYFSISVNQRIFGARRWAVQIFDIDTLVREFEHAKEYLAASPGNNYVIIVEGSKTEDEAEEEKPPRLHLVPKPSSTTDPRP